MNKLNKDFLQEFKSIEKDEFISILNRYLPDVENFYISFENDKDYGYRWKIAWDKIEYVNSFGEDCKFYSSFIFVYPFENQLLFQNKTEELDEELLNLTRRCPHFMQAFTESVNLDSEINF